MSNRNRPNIRKFPVKPGKNDLLKQAVNGIADDMVRSFNEMISAKMDALNWAIDQLPKVLEEASLPPLRFEIADGLYPFLLSGFSDIDDEEEDTDFQGMYPCFTADEDVPAGVQQYDLLLVVNDDEDSDEEGSRRIDALLARIGTDGSVQLFDGEDWVDMDEMIEDEDDDEDDDDFPFS